MNPIILTTPSSWIDRLRAALPADYTLTINESREGYVTRLADTRPALIVVDGGRDDWKFWTATPKSSPATRRIPIALVADDETTRHDALVSGADFALHPDELAARLPEIIRDYARIPDPAMLQELDCQCQEALPPRALEGVRKFQAGEYYQQHDLFEAQWVEEPGPVRDLYRAILQVGVAYYQITRGNHRGALKMLLRSVQWLSILPDVCQGVDVRQLREDSYRVRAELERVRPEDIGAFDRALLKPVRLVEDA
jgi:predicted metal-dependent hydrolase